MIYNAGTLAVSGNTVTGAGTNFTDATNLIRAGQTLVALTSPPQIFQIATVNTSTSLTLTATVSPAIVAGTRYAILTTDALSVDGLAQSIAQLISDYDESSAGWEAFAGTDANQTVTVSINGVSVTIPALGKLAQRGIGGAVPVEQGGTGGTTAAAARTGLGLGSVATKNAGKSDGNVPVVGDMFGFGHGTAGHIVLNSVSNNDIYSALSSYGSCVFRNNNPISATPHTAYGSSLWLQTGDTAGAIQIPYSPQGRITVISAQANVGVWSRTMYDTNNTTVDSNGNLRPASPIVKVSGDGTAELNYESEGVPQRETCSAAHSKKPDSSSSRLMMMTAINAAVAFQTIFQTTGISAIWMTPVPSASAAPILALQPILRPLGCQITSTSVSKNILPAKSISDSVIYDYVNVFFFLSRRCRLIYPAIHAHPPAYTARTL